MNLSHATLVLFLTAKIPGTDAGVRAAAKNVVKKLPCSQHDLIFWVINSKQPLEIVRQMSLTCRRLIILIRFNLRVIQGELPPCIHHLDQPCHR